MEGELGVGRERRVWALSGCGSNVAFSLRKCTQDTFESPVNEREDNNSDQNRQVESVMVDFGCWQDMLKRFVEGIRDGL